MSRHRNIRNQSFDLDDGYDDDDYDYDDYDATQMEYMYDRQAQHDLSMNMGALAEAATAAIADPSNQEDAEVIHMYFDDVARAVGNDFTENDIVEALRIASYEPSAAIEYLLEGELPKPPPSSQKKKKKKKKNKQTSNSATQKVGLDELDAAVETGTDVAKMGGPMITAPAPSGPLERAPSPSKQTRNSTALTISQPIQPNPTSRVEEPSMLAATNAERHPRRKTGPAFPVLPNELPSLPPQVADLQNEEYKQNLNLVVVGHVDAGKSTLMGHLLYKLGHVDQRIMHKYQKESDIAGKSSFAYAWILDEHEEERSRGVTVDVGVKYFETDHHRFTLLDAPGHRDFVPNMISGASQADAAILVVSAVENEFEAGFKRGGQTCEHALLVRAFGVTQLIVAVNKLDMVNWNKSRFDHIQQELLRFLQRVGFKSHKIAFVPVSGLSGENLDAAATDRRLTSWYQGTTLVEQLDKFAPSPKTLINQPLRFTVADVFKSLSQGLTVSGKLESGYAQIHSRLLVLPGSHTASIKSITRAGSGMEATISGECVEFGLGGIDENVLSPGQVLTWPEYPIPIVEKFKAQIRTFDTLVIPIVRGQNFILHTQHVEIPCNVTRMRRTLKNDGSLITKRPRHIGRSTIAIVTITLTKPIPLELYATHKRLGRFILRYSGSTVAAGMVLKMKK